MIFNKDHGTKSKRVITAQDSENLARYFTEIRHLEPLTKEEEIKLIKQIQKHNDQAALTRLINANLKFVISVAKNYQGQGVPLLDLVAEGNLGLLEAVKRFDTKRDLKFFSYAVWWIRIKMFTSLYNGSRPIRLPDNRALLVSAIKRCIDALEQKLNRYPTLDEIIEYCKKSKDANLKKLSESDISEAITYAGHTPSLSDIVGDSEDGVTMDQTIGDDSLPIDQINREQSIVEDLNRFLYHLTQYEYDILILSAGLNSEDNLRNKDIARLLKFKEKDIVKLKMKALKRLRKLNNVEHLRDYLQ